MIILENLWGLFSEDNELLSIIYSETNPTETPEDDYRNIDIETFKWFSIHNTYSTGIYQHTIESLFTSMSMVANNEVFDLEPLNITGSEKKNFNLFMSQKIKHKAYSHFKLPLDIETPFVVAFQSIFNQLDEDKQLSIKVYLEEARNWRTRNNDFNYLAQITDYMFPLALTKGYTKEVYDAEIKKQYTARIEALNETQ